MTLTLSGVNISDEEPPVAFGDLMYDAYTHSGIGRMYKLGFRYSM